MLCVGSRRPSVDPETSSLHSDRLSRLSGGRGDQLQVCDWHVSYGVAQLAVMHVVHALLVVSLHGVLQLFDMHVVKSRSGADAVGQL
jgi:hypothetical protein